MLRRLLCILILIFTLSLSGCNGVSLDYLLARLAVKLNLPSPQQPNSDPIPSQTPLPTKWVDMATPTPTPTAALTSPATPQSWQPISTAGAGTGNPDLGAPHP